MKLDWDEQRMAHHNNEQDVLFKAEMPRARLFVVAFLTVCICAAISALIVACQMPLR